MTEAVDFQADLWRPEGEGTATHITLPFDAKALFGRARCPVQVTINGHTWRTTTHVHDHTYQIVISAAVRTVAAVNIGDSVHVTVRKDDAVSAADVPAELAARLRTDAAAKDAYEALAPSHRREYARWVADAKLPATRVRRSAAAAERLKSGLRAQATA